MLQSLCHSVHADVPSLRGQCCHLNTTFTMNTSQFCLHKDAVLMPPSQQRCSNAAIPMSFSQHRHLNVIFPTLPSHHFDSTLPLSAVQQLDVPISLLLSRCHHPVIPMQPSCCQDATVPVPPPSRRPHHDAAVPLSQHRRLDAAIPLS